MPLRESMSLERVRADFDEIATLAGAGESGSDRFDAWLLSLVPTSARRVLDVGAGLGRLTWAMAAEGREVIGIDLSSVMIERARTAGRASGVSFRQGDFLTTNFDDRPFDCIISAAALHHMPQPAALSRLASLLAPGGRLILHDLRRNASIGDALRAYTALAADLIRRFVRTGRPLGSRRLRQAWARHGHSDVYLTCDEARALADRVLPGAAVTNHWLWRYTLVWDKAA